MATDSMSLARAVLAGYCSVRLRAQIATAMAGTKPVYKFRFGGGTFAEKSAVQFHTSDPTCSMNFKIRSVCPPLRKLGC